MDGNDLGMLVKVLMFLVKGLKYLFKLVLFTGLIWFCVPLGVAMAYEAITHQHTENSIIMNGLFVVMWYACYVICPLTFIQNLVRMIKKDRTFSLLGLVLSKRGKKGIEATADGKTVAIRTAADLSGVVFGKLGSKYVTMPESTDGHILAVGGAGSGKTAAIAIPHADDVERARFCNRHKRRVVRKNEESKKRRTN